MIFDANNNEWCTDTSIYCDLNGVISLNISAFIFCIHIQSWPDVIINLLSMSNFNYNTSECPFNDEKYSPVW